jgi:DNA repair protein RecN (Recombination protein N)
MPEARFEVALEPVPAPEGLPCAATGCEAAEFRLAANPGESPRPLRRVASGGELSRTFLALRGALREADAGMVLVFDEVDAASAGAAESVVAAELAGRHQALLHHPPQVAAFADALRAVKAERGRRGLARPCAARPGRGDRPDGRRREHEATRRHARHPGQGRIPGGAI